MKSAAALDRLRKDHRLCQVAAFADLEQSVLVAASHDPDVIPMSALRSLCADAKAALNGPLADLSGADAMEEEAPGDEIACAPGPVVTMQGSPPTTLHLFLRAQGHPQTVLCCLCDPACDPAMLIDDAQAVLGDFANQYVEEQP